MLYKKCDTPKSLLDFLLQIMPDLKDGPVLIDIMRKPSINNKAAKTLFKIWKDKGNTVGDYKLKRPFDIAHSELDLLQREGLVKYRDDTIEVTKKGVEVIKTMILGNDKSVFEDDGKILDYHTACSNIKPKKTAKKKVANKNDEVSTSWWGRVKNGKNFHM